MTHLYDSMLSACSVKELEKVGESVTLVQASQLFLGQLPKGKERKKMFFSSLNCFGKGQQRFERSEVERIFYHMILRQYLQEMVSFFSD